MLEIVSGVALISERLQYEDDEGKAKRGVFNEKKAEEYTKRSHHKKTKTSWG